MPAYQILCVPERDEGVVGDPHQSPSPDHSEGSSAERQRPGQPADDAALQGCMQQAPRSRDPKEHERQ